MSQTRRWVAGLVECLALVVDHLGQGLTLLAETIDPDASPEPDATTDTLDDQGRVVFERGDYTDHVPADETARHDCSDDCPCGPTFLCVNSPTGGDAWRRLHRPMPQEDA